MGKYKYVGDGPRVFPDLSLRVEPGDIVELDDDPPGGELFWTTAPAKAKTTEEKES